MRRAARCTFPNKKGTLREDALLKENVSKCLITVLAGVVILTLEAQFFREFGETRPDIVFL